jgi:phosphinothricin acetyltransferase
VTGDLAGASVGALAEGIEIRPMRAADADRVLAIYRAGIDTGNATFETSAPDWATWDRGHLPGHRYVAVDAAVGEVVGWVAVSPVSDRCVYAGVQELSVYVDPGAQGRGVGRALLAALIASTEAAGVWTLQTGIFPENTGSVALHEKAGFRLVGRRERVGRRHGVWRDVLMLERRSAVAGVD